MNEPKVWEQVSDASYFRKIMLNLVNLGFGPKNPVKCLRFGITGIGHSPNYQIETDNGSKFNFRGIGHSEASDLSRDFLEINLSSEYFSYKDIQRLLSLLIDVGRTTYTPEPDDHLSVPFLNPECVSLVKRAIRMKASEITHAADAGEAPVTMLIPDIKCGEGVYWRLAQYLITDYLSIDFKVSGEKKVDINGLPYGSCYKRISNK